VSGQRSVVVIVGVTDRMAAITAATVTVRGSADGYTQEIAIGRHRLNTDEPAPEGGTTRPPRRSTPRCDSLLVMRPLARVLVILSLANMAAPAAAAQGTSGASISGVVSDASGGVLPDALVEISSPVLIETVHPRGSQLR
jgi:hypothetical protein